MIPPLKDQKYGYFNLQCKLECLLSAGLQTNAGESGTSSVIWAWQVLGLDALTNLQLRSNEMAPLLNKYY